MIAPNKTSIIIIITKHTGSDRICAHETTLLKKCLALARMYHMDISLN